MHIERWFEKILCNCINLLNKCFIFSISDIIIVSRNINSTFRECIPPSTPSVPCRECQIITANAWPSYYYNAMQIQYPHRIYLGSPHQIECWLRGRVSRTCIGIFGHCSKLEKGGISRSASFEGIVRNVRDVLGVGGKVMVSNGGLVLCWENNGVSCMYF